MKKIKKFLSAVVFVVFLLLGFTGSITAHAATAPVLGTTSTYGVVSSTSNNINTDPQTIINGKVCGTTLTEPRPLTITGGEGACPGTIEADQTTALTTLNTQDCTSIAPTGGALNTWVIDGQAAGTFPPGCYAVTDAMTITTGTTVTLDLTATGGTGAVWVFKSTGGLTTGASTDGFPSIVLANGASASNVFWAPTGTSLGANFAASATATFIGTIIDPAGISLGQFANLLGRALDFQTTVTTDSNTITVPDADTTPPTLTSAIFTDDALKIGETSLVTFIFSEPITGFTNADLTIPNGGLTAVSSGDGGTTWTATFTPTPNIEFPTNVITVAMTGVADIAGNAGVGTTNSANYAIDTKAPTVIVTMSDYVLNIGDTALVTFTFSEIPAGFAVEDVTSFPNGVLTGFAVTGDTKIYTATFTPNTEINDATNIITVGTDWTDVAGNVGIGDNSDNYTIDTVSPRRRSRPQEGTINVVKIVINNNGGTKTIADFPLFINSGRVISGVTNAFSIFGTYIITETTDTQYTRTFSGDCDVDGQLSLNAGENKFCVITNNDISAPVVVPPVPPLIEVLKTASPLSLPAGSGSVIYTYTLSNIGTVPATDITMVGDSCSPIVLVSGDINNDLKLDVSETWVYTCSTTLLETYTNTIVATGWANGISAVDIASATVVVDLPIVPPLIHVVKKPNVFTLLVGGGAVTYSYTVTNPGTEPLSNVTITDDKCTGLPGRVVGHPGDLNGNNLLEPNEIWSFVCQTNITQTTVNTATASGEANGLIAKDLALATVVVATAAPISTPVPKLPNTGFLPEGSGITWNLTLLFGIFMLVAIPLVIIHKRHKV